jgi:hypothetical protein
MKRGNDIMPITGSATQIVLLGLTIYFFIMAIIGINNDDNDQVLNKSEWKVFFWIILVFTAIQLASTFHVIYAFKQIANY